MDYFIFNKQINIIESIIIVKIEGLIGEYHV